MIKYIIHVAYEDEIYEQRSKETEFNILDGDKDYFTDYNKAKSMWNKLVNQNEKFIQLNKLNTYYLMEFVQITDKKIKIIEKKRYI